MIKSMDYALRRQLVPDHGQPGRVARFVRNGKYLNHPQRFFNQYLIGFLFNNLAVVSGMAFLCMLLATTWRCLDSNWLGGWIFLYLPPGGRWSELWRPFLPAALCLSCWAVCWVGTYLKSMW